MSANDATTPRRYTDAEKAYMFHRGEYIHTPPPVPSGDWSTEMWINYIGDDAWRPSYMTTRHFIDLQAVGVMEQMVEVLTRK